MTRSTNKRLRRRWESKSLGPLNSRRWACPEHLFISTIGRGQPHRSGVVPETTCALRLPRLLDLVIFPLSDSRVHEGPLGGTAKSSWKTRSHRTGVDSPWLPRTSESFRGFWDFQVPARKTWQRANHIHI